MLEVVTDQVRTAARALDFPAVTLPDRTIAAGELAWSAFLAIADLTTLESAQRVLRRRTPPPRTAGASGGATRKETDR
jgi:hypothetical protein